MEHRTDKRLQKVMGVELWRAEKYVGYCQTNDIGNGGVSLEVIGSTFRQYDLLTLKLDMQSSHEPSYIERKAIVVYVMHNRLGLMWVDSHTGFINTLCVVGAEAA